MENPPKLLEPEGQSDLAIEPPIADLSFGPFSLRNYGASLYQGDALVRLGSRALQILAILASTPGRVVSKAELLDKVWPNTTVVENNLSVNVTALRRALGDGRGGAKYIVNVPGHGYRFVADVRRTSPLVPPLNATTAPGPQTNLPVRLRPAVGLARPLNDVNVKLEANNLVTIAGPAGVGKTTLALNVGQSRLPRHPDGVWLIDLAPISEASHVCVAIATTLRIEARSENPENALLQALAQSNALILLDNCEHLIGIVAALAATILQQCPDVVIITTSRETLRISGEAVYVLAPLDTPPDEANISVEEALSYPAVELLVERVAAAANRFVFSEEEAYSATRICRRLDGLPLAIEFASSLVGAFTLADVATRLDDLFKVLQSNIRTAPLRHRTLTAALDWSYELLTECEQVGLRRLAVFSAGFTLEGAAAVTGIHDLGEVGALLSKLHSKSFVTRDVASKELRFRLLETTRSYALEILQKTGEEIDVFRLHAFYYRDLLKVHRTKLGDLDIAEDAAELDNIRSALRFAVGPSGDIDLALSLTSGALPVWLGLSLVAECRTRLREVRALLTPERTESAEGWDLEITLRITEMVTTGVTEEAFGTWTHASAVAPSAPHTRRPDLADVLTRWVWNIRRANATEMKRFESSYAALVKPLRINHYESSRAWTEGLTSFQLGQLQNAKVRLSDFLELETAESRKIFLGRTGIDRIPGVYGALGATLCLLGDAAQGIRVARMAEDLGRATTKALPFSDGKIWTHTAYEIAMIEPTDLETTLDELVATARNQGLDSYLGYGLALKGLVAARQDRHASAELFLKQGIELLQLTGLEWASPWFHGQLGLSIGRQGRIQEAFQVVEDWTSRDRNPSGWCSPELHRLIASLHVLNEDLDQAEHELSQSIALASAQGAVAWSRRSSVDLSRLRTDRRAFRGTVSSNSPRAVRLGTADGPEIQSC